MEFVGLIVDHLTEHGVMNESRLYESPFTDHAPAGPEALFGAAPAGALIAVLDEVRRWAVAA